MIELLPIIIAVIVVSVIILIIHKMKEFFEKIYTSAHDIEKRRLKQEINYLRNDLKILTYNDRISHIEIKHVKDKWFATFEKEENDLKLLAKLDNKHYRK